MPFFAFSPDICKVVYTTNAIESLNSQLRKVTKTRGSFPTEETALKVLYLAILRATERWTHPLTDWRSALNTFKILFDGRVPARS